ncbi:MAG3240 family lipoprotein [Mycoplasmopsis agalactiae]|uniref:MAG3240 family lipoprotein n=1 Tax=Mycoplasmopsis agalactiae TaxID=2110 RepID=UPI002F40A74C
MSKKINLLLPITISTLPVLISSSCNNEDDIFNLKINSDVKASDIFYKTFLSQLKTYTLDSLFNNLQGGILTLNLPNKVDEFKLTSNKDDIIFKYKNKKYSLKNVASKINGFDFSEILRPFTYENEDGKFIVKRTRNINDNTDIDILFKLKTEGKLDYSDFFEYKSKIFQNYYKKGILDDLSIPDLQYMLQSAFINSNSQFPIQVLSINTRSKAFFKSKFQQDILEKRLSNELKIYNFTSNGLIFDHVKFNNLKIDTDTIKLNIDLLDANDNSLLSDKYKSLEFKLTNFSKGQSDIYFDLKTKAKLTIDNDEVKFNELVNNPEIKFKPNPLSYKTIDDLMHPTKGYEAFNLNNTEMLLSELKDDILLSNTPAEFDFKIDKFEKTKLLNNSLSIGKLIINDAKTGQEYNWYSIDFTPHKHIFLNGLYLKNELGTINKNKDTYFSYSVNDNNFDNKGNLNITQGIKAADFIENSFNDIANFLIYQNKDNLLLWQNNAMSNLPVLEVLKHKHFYEKWLSIIFSQYTLLYNINNDADDDGLIKKVDVKLIDSNKYEASKHGLGTVPISINFINHRNQKMLQTDYHYNLIGFKGYDKGIIESKKAELKEEYKSDLPLKNKTLPYLIRVK